MSSRKQGYTKYIITCGDRVCRFTEPMNMAYKFIVVEACNIMGIDYSPNLGLYSGNPPTWMRPNWTPKSKTASFVLARAPNGFRCNVPICKFNVYRKTDLEESEAVTIFVNPNNKPREIVRQYNIYCYNVLLEKHQIDDWEMRDSEGATLPDVPCSELQDANIFLHRPFDEVFVNANKILGAQTSEPAVVQISVPVSDNMVSSIEVSYENQKYNLSVPFTLLVFDIPFIMKLPDPFNKIFTSHNGREIDETTKISDVTQLTITSL